MNKNQGFKQHGQAAHGIGLGKLWQKTRHRRNNGDELCS